MKEQSLQEIQYNQTKSTVIPSFEGNKDIQTKVELLITSKKKPEKKFNNNPPKKEVPKPNDLANNQNYIGKGVLMDNQFDAINESISTNQGPLNIRGFNRVHDSRLNSAIGQELRDQVSSAAS